MDKDKGQKKRLKRGRGKERKMEREKYAKRGTGKERDEKTVSNRNRKTSMKVGGVSDMERQRKVIE